MMLNRQLSSSSKKCSVMKAKENNSKEKQKSYTKRSPFQDLNNGGFSRNNSSSSSISSSVSVEAPRGCLGFFLSNPSSSKTPFLHRPNYLSRNKTSTTPKSAPIAKTRSSNSSSCSRSNKPSNENHLPKLKIGKKKKNPPCQQQPTSLRTGPKSKLLANLDNLLSNLPSGSEEFGQKSRDSKWKMKNFDNAGEPFEHFGSHFFENCTPVGKLACGSVLDCANSDDGNTLVEQGSNSATKTPPVQASLSPEIQCGSSVLNSTNTRNTPSTCYGAGHFISGITDKRKCRPKGILTVGVGLDSSGCNMEGNVTGNDDSGGHYIRILSKSTASLIPLPAEASMSWHLSPCHAEDGCEKGDSANRLHQKGNLVGSASLDLPSSPSSCDVFASYLLKNNNYSGTSTLDATPSGRKTRITLLSPGRLPEFQGFSGISSDKVGGDLSSSSPFVTPSCKAVLSQEERKYGGNLAGENSPFSTGSLSSGNIMQTPKSESSSERHVFPFWLNAEGSPKHHKEIAFDSLVEVLQMQSLSPKSHIQLWDAIGSSSPSNFIDCNQLQKTLDNHDSWISDSTLENLPHSQMRISWREGLASRIFEMDELDCCRCLSDEENDAEGSNKEQSKAHHEFNTDAKSEKFSNDGFGSPEFLDHEPRIGVKGKAKSSSQRPNSCAESISTDGGGLVASGDSDWTLLYKNQLFQL